ncbi:MAG: hypothetical protein K0S39_3746 [Paenibacillus sp.]|nr:hypothetical protein [Paenibacillus sp.]
MKRMVEYGLLLLLALGAAAGFWTVHADAANQDLEQLLSLSGQIIASDKKVIVKHAGTYRTFDTRAYFEQAGREVSTQLGFPEDSIPVITETQDHLLYKTAVTDSDGIERTLLWIGFPNGTSELIVSAQAEGDEEADGIRKVQKYWTGKLEAMDVKPDWNVMIQGSPVPAAESIAQELQFHSTLTKQMQAEEVGRYEDAGSLSISYYSPQIGKSVSLGEKEKMNLQVAVHRNSNTQQQRITIGSPAISIEY